MKTLKWMILALLVAGWAMAFVSWKRGEALRQVNAALRAENQALQEQGAAAADAQAARHEQELQRFRAEAQEVQKLRGEVGLLRAGAKELANLRADSQQLRGENQQLRAAAGTAAPAAPAVAVTVDHFTRDTWAFSGYNTPEAALVSAIWAMREGNAKTYLDSLSPEEQVRMAKTWENKSEAEVAAKHQQDVSTITGMRILDRQEISPNEMRMNVYVEGVGRMETVSMKRVGNEWKFGGFIRK